MGDTPREDMMHSRIANDNLIASHVPTGAKYTSKLFGSVTLIGQVGTDEDGWDLYEVKHSDVIHTWTSALIARQDWED